MKITPEVVEKHGISKNEFKKICILLKRNPNLVELGIFQLCGMNIALTNHQKFI